MKGVMGMNEILKLLASALISAKKLEIKEQLTDNGTVEYKLTQQHGILVKDKFT